MMLFKKRKCKYGWGDNKCNRLALRGDEHCIFHSKDIEGKKDKFDDAFWKEFERQKKDEKEYDFTAFVFPGDISFLKREFENDAYFRDAQFSGKADFREAKFSEIPYFVDAKFYGAVSFANAQFYWVSFVNAQFSGDAYFTNAQLSGEAHFSDAQFSGEAYFRDVRFSANAYFGGAQLSGEAHFSNSQFSGVTYFSKAQFSGVVDFGGGEFHNKSFFGDVKFEDFNQCNMTDTSFYNVFALLEYISENRNKSKRHEGIKYLHEKCKPILGEETVFRLPILSREIRDDLYLMSFKEKHPKLFYLWWLFADCGRSFFRWALWSFGFAIGFAFIYYSFYKDYMLNFQTIYVSEEFPLFSFIYYSIVTFTTLGFGDIVPRTGWLQFWVMLEVILGYIMLGGLISILANKLARRS
jgi:uncharacterized protein YjbI with pentapeptide repeats